MDHAFTVAGVVMRQKRQIKNKSSEQHEFAFFYPRVTADLIKLPADSVVKIVDAEVFHRVSRVVRLEPGQGFVLFDRTSQVRLELQSLKEGQVTASLVGGTKNKQLEPRITFWLPLLKREQFQDALYSLVELGATTIQPVVTKKVQRAWGGEHEYERSMSIMVAAAEQSKHFSFSELVAPKNLETCCAEAQKSNATKIFFDPEGIPLPSVLESLAGHHSSEIILLIGPEGDLTDQEKEMLKECGFMVSALTPTILRASQAAALAMGIFRSCVC